MKKVLNLYAGIGGNRKLWTDVNVTAVEIVPEIANIYQDFFPDDTVIIEDAHQYLLEHFKEFDFIWSSPPCPSHSRIRYAYFGKSQAIYPDMKLWQEILFLQFYAKCSWVVENVIPYYSPLLPATMIGRHLFWSNFHINQHSDFKNCAQKIQYMTGSETHFGFSLDKYKIKNKKTILRNLVSPKLGKHIFDCAFKFEQKKLG